MMNSRPRFGLLPLILLVPLLFSIFSTARDVQANSSVNVDISFFHDALAPYGNWINHPTYGQVWYPRDVANNWRPYTEGYWAYTDDYGWLWVSYEPWGWAPFHYGRWAWDNWYGWVWVPGRTWAPAWVFWRSGGGYAAWAPMPPNVVWQPGIGLNISYFNYERDLSWDSWVAVREYDLPHRHLSRHICPPRENPQIINVTSYTNNVTIVNNTIVNHGVPVRRIENITHKPVEHIVPKVHNQADLNLSGHQGGQPNIVRLPMAAPTPEENHHNEELARRLDGKRPDGTRADFPKAHLKKSGDFEPRLPGRLIGAPVTAHFPDAMPEVPNSLQKEKPVQDNSLPAISEAPPVSRDPDLNGHRNKSAGRKNQKALLSAQPSDQQAPGILQSITPVYPQADGVSDTVPVINPESESPDASLQNQRELLEQPKKSELNPEVDRQQIEKRHAENLQRQPAIDLLKQELAPRQERQKRRETEMQQTVESSRQEARQMQQQEAARTRALENQQQLELQQQQAEQARQEARQMQQQEAARTRTLENQQQLELQQQQAEQARQEARRMQQQEAARARALENQQQIEAQRQSHSQSRSEMQQLRRKNRAEQKAARD